jgi:hypothetical protein
LLPGSTGEQLWEYGLVSRLLADGSLGAKAAGLLALIETPEAMEAYLLRAQGQDDAKRRARRGVEATQLTPRLSATQMWPNPFTGVLSGDGSLPSIPNH